MNKQKIATVKSIMQIYGRINSFSVTKKLKLMDMTLKMKVNRD